MLTRLRTLAMATALFAPFACAHAAPDTTAAATTANPFKSTVMGQFTQPWSMAFLPNGRLLVAEKGGKLKLFTPSTRKVHEVRGVPAVAYGIQGGLGDVVVAPGWGNGHHRIYLSYAEAGPNGTRGAAVASAVLSLFSDGTGALSSLKVIWRQPKVVGMKQYSHRLVFSRPAGTYLFISSGDRSLMEPAQDKHSTLGKIVRLYADGTVPSSNPFYGQGTMASQIWTLGHRNVLGMAFAPDNRLWVDEMGPAGGDEFNLIEKGRNYGWPLVSQGDHYDGTRIPRHSTRPEMAAPKKSWWPSIAPAGMIFYTGNQFPDWKGDALLAGLASKAIVRVRVTDGNKADEVARYKMGVRIREVEQGPDGAVWVLEDQASGAGGRLLKLTPTS